MSLGISSNNFEKNGKPYFLISGEIHYFRVAPKLWEKHLMLLKQSGANTTSTYIPWDWHEYEEGKYDFTGKTNPARNLVKYIKLCKKVGLDLIVKPGPYILAEYEGHGIPQWFIQKAKKETHALNYDGTVISQDLMSYLSDEFMHYSNNWYDNVMPIISNYQEKNGGPIIMMQVCNEVGVFQWLSGKIDYNDSVVRLFREFLKEKYSLIEKINFLYNTNYKSIDEINLPQNSIENKGQYRFYFDFHLFFRNYIKLYLMNLQQKIKSFDIDIQLTHNIPGWIYGNAAELPMLATLYSGLMNDKSDIVFGLDHIPEFISFRNAHSDLACNKVLSGLQPHAPVWAAEFQAGTREHHVKCDANDLETFYFASLAHGMKGFNYYMFSQGVNPENKGYYGKTFYYQTPLLADSSSTKLYSSVKKVNRFIKKYESVLLNNEIHSDIAVAIYKPYFMTEFISSQINKESRLNVRKIGLSVDPRFLREEILFNGLLRSLQTLNYAYDIYDLERGDLEALKDYKQLWVTSADYMDAGTQLFLAEYVKNGGSLVIYPTLPTLDLYLNPCTVLKDELNLESFSYQSSNKISSFGIDEIFTYTDEKNIFTNNGAVSVATTRDNKTCGIKKTVGNGSVISLGFSFGYTSDEHLELIRRIVSDGKIKHHLKISDPDIQYSVLKNGERELIIFLNYHNEKKSFMIDSNKVDIKPFSYKVIERNKKIKSIAQKELTL